MVTDLNHLRASQKRLMSAADAAGASRPSASAFYIRSAIVRELQKRDLQAAQRPGPAARIRRSDSDLERCSLRIGSMTAMPEGAVVGTKVDWTPPEPPEE